MIKIFSSEAEASNNIPRGKIQLLIIDGRKIGVARFNDGLVAFDNMCPHQNEPLNKGMLTKYNEIVCPLHFYRFNSTTGNETNNRCKPLELFSVHVKEDGVYISI